MCSLTLKAVATILSTAGLTEFGARVAYQQSTAQLVENFATRHSYAVVSQAPENLDLPARGASGMVIASPLEVAKADRDEGMVEMEHGWNRPPWAHGEDRDNDHGHHHGHNHEHPQWNGEHHDHPWHHGHHKHGEHEHGEHPWHHGHHGHGEHEHPEWHRGHGDGGMPHHGKTEFLPRLDQAAADKTFFASPDVQFTLTMMPQVKACHRGCGDDASCHASCPRPWEKVQLACKQVSEIRECHHQCCHMNHQCHEQCPVPANPEWAAPLQEARSCHGQCAPGDWDCHRKCPFPLQGLSRRCEMVDTIVACHGACKFGDCACHRACPKFRTVAPTANDPMHV